MGQDPPVLDARELLLDPRSVLGELCRRLGLRVRRGDAALEGRAAARGRRLGAALVRQRPPLDRVRALPRRTRDAPVPERGASAARGVHAATTSVCSSPRSRRAALPRARASMSDALPDPRNANLWVHVGGRLVERAEAKVSVFDSSVQGGDAVLGGAARLRRARVRARSSPRSPVRVGARARLRAGAVARGGRGRDLRHAAGERHARRRAHPPHADAGREGDQRHEPGAQPVGAVPDRARRVEAAGLRPSRHPPGDVVVAAQPAAVPRLEDPPQQPAQQHPGQDRGQPRRRRRRGDARRRGLRGRDQRHQPVPGRARRAGDAGGRSLPARHHARHRARDRAPPPASRRSSAASRSPSSTPPTRCSRPARWASSRRCSRSTVARSAPARSVRSPSACGPCSPSGPRARGARFLPEIPPRQRTRTIVVPTVSPRRSSTNAFGADSRPSNSVTRGTSSPRSIQRRSSARAWS